MSLTEGIITPPLFRLWAGITCISGALERRVWAKTGPGVVYPNLYTLLVAPPGVGKFVIETVRELWQDSQEPGTRLPAFHVASDSVTNASMMDELNKSKDIMIVPAGPPLIFHSLLIASEEFQVLLPGYDNQFIASLNSIYNNKSLHREARRTGSVKELNIENPNLTILAGAQPSYFASTFPDEAWSTGFCRRIIMIFSSESPLRSVFFSPGDMLGLRAQLLKRLGTMSAMYGPMLWEQAAVKCLDDWHLAEGPPRPSHSKLTHYNRSRTVFVIKLAIISAISRHGQMRIDHFDIERAMEWLIEAEKLMPDIFREMIGKSDRQIMEELHLYMTKIWISQGKKGHITSQQIYDFLTHRVPSDKVEKLFMAADKAGFFARVGGSSDLFVPKAMKDFSAE